MSRRILLVEDNEIGWRIAHGDVDGAEHTMRMIMDLPADALAEMGRRARRLATEQYSREASCGRFCDAIDPP